MAGSAFHLPEWCSQVHVQDFTVPEACSLPPLPRPSIVMPVAPPTVIVPPPVDFCQCIHIKPQISLPVKPAASEPCVPIPPSTQSFLLEESYSDCCSGRYRLKVVLPISCALAGVPASTETTGAWVRRPKVPPPPEENKPKARLLLEKDCEVCAINSISIPIEVPCVLDSFKDVNVKAKIVEKKRHLVPPVQNSVAEFDVAKDDCALGADGIVLSIQVPEGCDHTVLSGVVHTTVNRGRPAPGTRREYKAGVTKSSVACNFRISFPDIEIPVPGCPRTSFYGEVASKPAVAMSVFATTTSGTDCHTELKVRLNMPKLSGEFSGDIGLYDIDSPQISGWFEGGGRMEVGKLNLRIKIPKCETGHTTDVRYMDGGSFLINGNGVLVFKPAMKEMKFVRGLLKRVYDVSADDITVISTTKCPSPDD